jgi:hypothetical protein
LPAALWPMPAEGLPVEAIHLTLSFVQRCRSEIKLVTQILVLPNKIYYLGLQTSHFQNRISTIHMKWVREDKV